MFNLGNCRVAMSILIVRPLFTVPPLRRQIRQSVYIIVDILVLARTSDPGNITSRFENSLLPSWAERRHCILTKYGDLLEFYINAAILCQLSCLKSILDWTRMCTLLGTHFLGRSSHWSVGHLNTAEHIGYNQCVSGSLSLEDIQSF